MARPPAYLPGPPKPAQRKGEGEVEPNEEECSWSMRETPTCSLLSNVFRADVSFEGYHGLNLTLTLNLILVCDCS